ncbi:MAG: NAD(P)-binding domain-containing protein, partial [Hyphomicrobiales bacterium]|nr:NAD(P)-binding domain-containing protein [Hyphomicrobiales bacterium]
SVQKIETLIIGGGQAGLAMSEQLSKRGLSHLIVERRRIAERWRSERWDGLHANGPAWHDRLSGLSIAAVDSDGFATRDQMVQYFTAYAERIAAPVRCGVAVTALHKIADGTGFRAETSEGAIEATNVVAATGPFQRSIIPAVVPPEAGILQMHSSAYRNPGQLPEGAVLVVGAGSSGTQIADELSRAGRRVYLSVGRHERPPRRYRGRDFCWWLGVLGLWNATAPDPSIKHVTIAVSGAYGGQTIDFRRLAARGVMLLGRAKAFGDGVMRFSPDLASNLAQGDASYLSLLDAADAFAAREGLDLPEEPAARTVYPEPSCVTDPVLKLDLHGAGIGAIVWATGYALDFGWLKVDAFDEKGRPVHRRGVANVPGLYFLGLSWLSRRASSFIFGVEHDAAHLADHIAARVERPSSVGSTAPRLSETWSDG